MPHNISKNQYTVRQIFFQYSFGEKEFVLLPPLMWQDVSLVEPDRLRIAANSCFRS